MGRTDSNAPGCAPEVAQVEADEFDPLIDDFVSKERRYAHFDLALSEGARGNVRATDEKIHRHAFWPLLAFSKIERRARKDADGAIFFEGKEREIKFGSHADAALLEAYARRLSFFYEAAIKAAGVSDSVLAYRSNCGDNISQSKELFDQIRVSREVTAVGIDIRKFFDRVSHDVIVANLREILKLDRLPKADFTIFKRMTAFEWVDADRVRDVLDGVSTPKGRICSAAQFRQIVRSNAKLINKNKNNFGIPQGTPLSGLYANLSLLDFDKKLRAFTDACGGIYRRYSDDIALLFPIEVESEKVIDFVDECLSSIGLTIAENKTLISNFKEFEGILSADKPFQYLGFTFDGTNILIRQSSLNRYYSKMSRGIRSKIWAAKKSDIPRDTMFMRHLFKKYTHFGRHRNFPRYAYRAARIMNSPQIKKQLRNHIKIFNRQIKYHFDAIY